MGLLDGLSGNALNVDAANFQQRFSQTLAAVETIEHGYHLIRYYFNLASKCCFVDKQGRVGGPVQ